MSLLEGRPPFYPSYPAYPGPPGGGYPGNEWRAPPPYNPSMPTGHPMMPPSTLYPDLRPGGYDNKGRVCNCSGRPVYSPGPQAIYPGTTRWTCQSGCGQSEWRSPTGLSHDWPKFERYSTCTQKEFGWIPPSHCMGTVSWVPSGSGAVPPDAVHGGQDRDGGPIFIGRAYHEGDLLPAKICPNHGCAFVAYGGQEITKMHYEVLVSQHVAWKYARGGETPPEAIRVGATSAGEPLFVGRTMLEGTMTPGKVHPSHGVLYVPFEGREVPFPEYEILILN